MLCEHWSDDKGTCGQEGAHPYLTGWKCALHTPAALAGRPEASGQDGGPRPGAQPYSFRPHETTRKHR